MKIVVAVDSFKGSLTAQEACNIIADAFYAECSSLQIIKQPLADGGEGTGAIVLKSTNAQWVPCRVMGPLPDMLVDAGFVWLDQTRTALVEMATASGITLLPSNLLNPLVATTFGTGQLIAKALERKPAKIVLAVGGSATVDGGVGAAMALGWKFLDDSGKSIELGGAQLGNIKTIIEPEDHQPVDCEILCDVTNPLTGPTGAAQIFGPQKGAAPKMVTALDKGLIHLAKIVREQLHKEIETIPGSGAAGGLGGGAIAFLNGRLVPGIEAIITITGLNKHILDANWVITGEGSFDLQSLNGKVVSGIVHAAKGSCARIGIIAGTIRLDENTYKQAGISAAASCLKPGMQLDYAIKNAQKLLSEAAREFARTNFLPKL